MWFEGLLVGIEGGAYTVDLEDSQARTRATQPGIPAAYLVHQRGCFVDKCHFIDCCIVYAHTSPYC
jgi:hypothetical protein